MQCFRHPETAAAGTCVVCGRGVCRACIAEPPARVLCSEACSSRQEKIDGVIDHNIRFVKARDLKTAVIAVLFGVMCLGVGYLSSYDGLRLMLVVIGLLVLFTGVSIAWRSREARYKAMVNDKPK